VDFDLFPDARGTERNGQKRENQAQNRPGSAEGEVRKFPHEPSRTRGNTRDRPRKNPNSDELGFLYWWSWRELNPRPQAFFEQFYMRSVLIWFLATGVAQTHATPAASTLLSRPHPRYPGGDQPM